MCTPANLHAWQGTDWHSRRTLRIEVRASQGRAQSQWELKQIYTRALHAMAQLLDCVMLRRTDHQPARLHWCRVIWAHLAHALHARQMASQPLPPQMHVLAAAAAPAGVPQPAA
jgi:hypothetical protein